MHEASDSVVKSGAKNNIPDTLDSRGIPLQILRYVIRRIQNSSPGGDTKSEPGGDTKSEPGRIGNQQQDTKWEMGKEQQDKGSLIRLLDGREETRGRPLTG
jgi:hypothetical protein